MSSEADIIKEFLVAVGFKVDASSFNKFDSGLGKATGSVLKFGKSVTAVLGAVELFVGALAANFEKLYFISQRGSAAVANIEAVAFAAGQLGSSADAAKSAMDSLSMSMKFNPGIRGLVQSLGVPKQDLQDISKTLLDLGQKFQTMPINVGRVYANALGIDDKTFLALRSGEFQKHFEEGQAAFREMGVDADEAAKKSHEFMDEFRKFGLYMEALGMKLLLLFEPFAEKVLKWLIGVMQDLAPKIDLVVTEVGKLASAFMDVFGPVIEAVAKNLKDITDTSFRVLLDILRTITALLKGDWSTAWKGMADAASSAINMIIGNVVRLVNALGNTAVGRWIKRQLGIAEDATLSTPTVLDSWKQPDSAYAAPRYSGSATGTSAPANQNFSRTGGGSSPIGVRQNNPGNLRRWGNAPRNGGFAMFNTPYDGFYAMAGNLLSYAKQGINTISAIVHKWAPSADGNNEAAYRAALVKATGFAANQPLNMRNPVMLQRMMAGITQHEQGGNPWGTDLISSAANARLGGVKMTQVTNITVHGADAAGAGRAVVGAQSDVNNQLLRNLKSAAQ